MTATDPAAVRREAMEEAARIVDEGIESYAGSGGKYLSKRGEGNTIGLSYAAAIREATTCPAEAMGDAERVAQLEGLCADYEQALTDKRRLTREIDVAMHGVDGAAKQASLCDLIEPAKRLRSERDAAEARAQAAEAEAGRLREAFQDLESTASRVAWFGPITGPHWPPLSTALVKARAALAPQGSEAAEQGDRG